MTEVEMQDPNSTVLNQVHSEDLDALVLKIIVPKIKQMNFELGIRQQTT